MAIPRKLETLRIGRMGVEDASFDVRVVRDTSAITAFHVVVGGALEEAAASLSACLEHAERTLPGLTWRDGLVVQPGERPCPICGAPDHHDPRYPRALCPACVLEAADETGCPLRFSNAGLEGGFRAERQDGSVPKEPHRCWVRGIACHADEARFGGIVVQISS